MKRLGWCGFLLTSAILPLSLQAASGPSTTSDQHPNMVIIDAGTPSEVPKVSSYHVNYASSPSDQTLGLNTMYLTMNDKPWLPVMGEFHYDRVPKSDWEEEILKMKAAGVQIVSTYVFWIVQEEVEDQFDWSGRRDLRHFIELCAKHGMYVWVRIGPWDHGEMRNGGLPDWLLKKGPTRRDDPVFMSYTAKLYAQIGDQLKGLLWKDGGPVIGVQLENEYAMRGPGEGKEYILALKKLAINSGLEVPFYTVTGWDSAVVPQGQVIPVFGGYPAAPWDASRGKLPPSEVYLFRFASRVAGNMGMMGARGINGLSDSDESDTPFITAEMGGGIQNTYHRRPVLDANDVAAMMPVMLGSGVNLYGTYMFQGGQNPEGKLTTLQESQATGYPNDLPVKSYDFQAPLGEFGQERESFRKLKVIDYFLNSFGQELAPMSSHAPTIVPHGPRDFSTVRAAVRNQGDHGFLFVNNYVHGYSMPEREDVQFRIQLPHSTLVFPLKPVDIPSGAYFVWPFNLDLGGTTLRYSTTQLFTRLRAVSQTTWFFEENPGIPAEFAFDDAPGLSVSAPGGMIRRSGGIIIVRNIPTGLDHGITLRRGSGAKVRLILLTQHQAENAWTARIGDEESIVETDQSYFAGAHHIFLQSLGRPQCAFQIYPAAQKTLSLGGRTLIPSDSAGISYYSATIPAHQQVALQYTQIRKAGAVPPVRMGPSFPWRPHGVAEVPPDSAFSSAAEWQITVPQDPMNGLRNAFLVIRYTGDIARLTSNGKLLDDNFYNGTPWHVGLRRFASEVQQGPLELSILPLRKDAPIYLQHSSWPHFDDYTQAVALKSLSLIPEYQFSIRTGP
ncbi:MAG: beta-galactosidase [Acidobacteriaceae bacterium]